MQPKTSNILPTFCRRVADRNARGQAATIQSLKDLHAAETSKTSSRLDAAKKKADSYVFFYLLSIFKKTFG